MGEVSGVVGGVVRVVVSFVTGAEVDVCFVVISW